LSSLPLSAKGVSLTVSLPPLSSQKLLALSTPLILIYSGPFHTTNIDVGAHQFLDGITNPYFFICDELSFVKQFSLDIPPVIQCLFANLLWQSLQLSTTGTVISFLQGLSALFRISGHHLLKYYPWTPYCGNMVSKHPIHRSSYHNLNYLLPAMFSFKVKLLQHPLCSFQNQCCTTNDPIHAVSFSLFLLGQSYFLGA
jgi:hypothetical protein